MSAHSAAVVCGRELSSPELVVVAAVEVHSLPLTLVATCVLVVVTEYRHDGSKNKEQKEPPNCLFFPTIMMILDLFCLAQL